MLRLSKSKVWELESSLENLPQVAEKLKNTLQTLSFVCG